MEVAAGGDEKPPADAWKKTPEGGGENSSNVNNGGGNSSEKPKRKMKSPYQLEVLEQTYAGWFFFYFNFLGFDLLNKFGIFLIWFGL